MIPHENRDDVGISEKNLKNKGFTLVEVIVVLVILAILAAITIPMMTGYINKAAKDAYIDKARYAVLAAQSVGAEYYANGKFNKNDLTQTNGVYQIYYTAHPAADSVQLKMRNEITALSELPVNTFLANVDYDENGRLIFLQMYTTNGGRYGAAVNSVLYSNFTDRKDNVHSGYCIWLWNKKQIPDEVFASFDPARTGIKIN